MSEGVARPSGSATFEILRKRSWVPEELDARLRAYRSTDPPRGHRTGVLPVISPTGSRSIYWMP
jgi:hypothetical protein